MVGYSAAVIALGLGAQVTILDTSIDRLRRLEEVLRGRVELLMSTGLEVERAALEADLVIGAVLVAGARAPRLLSEDVVRAMKRGAVVCDVSIDQGGCFETSRPTTHADPVYLVDGVLHYCVTNIPSAVPITSTQAWTNVTLPYVEAIAEHGYREAVVRDHSLARGTNAVAGRLTHEAVAEAYGPVHTPLDKVVPLEWV